MKNVQNLIISANTLMIIDFQQHGVDKNYWIFYMQ